MAFTRTNVHTMRDGAWFRKDRTPAPADTDGWDDLPASDLYRYWRDEFDGSAVNSSVWYQYENTYGDGNNEEQRYRAQNITVAGSAVTIRGKREAFGGADFTSGFLSTGSRTGVASPAPSGNTYFPKYGRYEMRAKLPHGQGLWPAFWLRHRDGAAVCEVDIMEYFHAQTPGQTSVTLHRTNNAGTAQSNVSKDNQFFETPRYSGHEWHTWAVDIIPEGSNVRFKGYVDGVQNWSYLDTSATNWSSRYSSGNVFDISLNLAIGGNWTGHPDDPLAYSRYLSRCIGPGGGTPPSSCSIVYQGQTVQAPSFTAGSADFVIDYVRVWEYRP